MRVPFLVFEGTFVHFLWFYCSYLRTILFGQNFLVMWFIKALCSSYFSFARWTNLWIGLCKYIFPRVQFVTRSKNCGNPILTMFMQRDYPWGTFDWGRFCCSHTACFSAKLTVLDHVPDYHELRWIRFFPLCLDLIFGRKIRRWNEKTKGS